MSPKINVYLPDDLALEVKASGIPVSAVCQQALADAVAAARTGPDTAESARGHSLERSFTKRAYDVLAAAEGAAGGTEATTVDLVGALVDSQGLALIVLRAAEIEPADLAEELRARAQRRSGRPGTLESLAGRAVEQARELGHSYVGTEHLLLGLTAGPDEELARATLHDMGLDHARALQGVATALEAFTYARETLTFSGLSAPIRAALEEIRARLARLEGHAAG